MAEEVAVEAAAAAGTAAAALQGALPKKEGCASFVSDAPRLPSLC